MNHTKSIIIIIYKLILLVHFIISFNSYIHLVFLSNWGMHKRNNKTCCSIWNPHPPWSLRKCLPHQLCISHNAPWLEANRKVLALFELRSRWHTWVEIPIYWPPIQMHYGICANGLIRLKKNKFVSGRWPENLNAKCGCFFCFFFLARCLGKFSSKHPHNYTDSWWICTFLCPISNAVTLAKHIFVKYLCFYAHFAHKSHE